MKKNLPPVDLESIVVVAVVAAVEKSSHFVAETDAPVSALHNLHFDHEVVVVAAVAVRNYTFQLIFQKNS